MNDPNIYFYRVNETDEDGEPLDYGVVTASSPEIAYALLWSRFVDLGIAWEDRTEEVPIFLYELTPPPHTQRVCGR